MVLKLPVDFAKKIGEVLGLQMQGVDQLFTVEEDRAGYFVAKLKPQQRLDKTQFKTMCALTRDLGGKGYVIGSGQWLVPGPFAKKPPEASSGQGTGSEHAYKPPSEPVLTHPPEPSGKVFFTMLPVEALLSTPFQSRDDPDDTELTDLAESLKAYGVLEPIVVRQKPNGLYEIAIGERRVKAARKAGIVEVPAIVRAMSDKEVAICNLIENIHRKDLSDKEKTKALGEIARTWKLNAQQIAEEVRMSERWVYKYLPDEFKKPEPEQLAKGREESQESLDSARRALSTESEQTRQGVPCARCGDITSHPFSAPDKKFYCDEGCYKQAIAESEAKEEAEEEEVEEKKTSETEEETSKREKEPKPEPIDVAEFTCKICGEVYRISHVKPGVHELELMKK